MDPPATEEMMEWATASGHVVKVLFGDPDADGMSLVWSWFAPNYPFPATRTAPTACTTSPRASSTWAARSS